VRAVSGAVGNVVATTLPGRQFAWPDAVSMATPLHRQGLGLKQWSGESTASVRPAREIDRRATPENAIV